MNSKTQTSIERVQSGLPTWKIGLISLFMLSLWMIFFFFAFFFLTNIRMVAQISYSRNSSPYYFLLSRINTQLGIDLSIAENAKKVTTYSRKSVSVEDFPHIFQEW